MNEVAANEPETRYFSSRLTRQNHYLDHLEKELDQARTETEAHVVLSLLRSTRERLDRLEEEFINSCGAWA